MNQVATTAKPLRQVANVRELLVNEQARDQLAKVAASHMKPERMMRLVANAIRTTPKLAECDPMSLLGGLMTCASLGLEPNTVLGHAYLVPFRNNKKGITEVQIIIGYKGLIDLARRSGHISSISAGVHYSDDELWDFEDGTDARLRHRPGPQEGKKVHAWAVAKFVDGGFAMAVMPWSAVMKIRDGSQNWQSAVKFNSTDRNPWTTHEDEMAKKTAIRALSKMLPLSTEFRDALEADEAKADYSAFAMDASAGLTIEGDVVDEDDGRSGAEAGPPAQEEAPRQETKMAAPPAKGGGRPAAAGKAGSKPAASAPAQDDEDPGPDGDERVSDAETTPESDAGDDGEPEWTPEQERLVEQIASVLSTSQDAGAIEVDLEMFAEQIAFARETAPHVHKAIMDAADEARERVAKG